MNLKDFIKSKIKTLRYLAEALVVRLGLLIFGAMKPQTASDVAAAIAKFVGKKIPVHNLAYQNLSRAMPELSEGEKEKILDDMWDNLGRIVGEYPHIAKCPRDQLSNMVEMSDESLKNIQDIIDNGKGGIIFSGHIGNWEIGPKIFLNHGLKVKTVYRPLNNPYVEKMTASIRGSELIEKGASGNRKIIETIKNGEFVVIMADQKFSEGESIQFFNDMAVTATSMARIALKYDIPLIPARSIRVGKNFKFKVQLEKPLAIQKTGNINSDSLNLTRKINIKLEEWIREFPAQWFWVHNRWKKK
jgi:KDO2-lipid IV(A) lauroyltransferase